MVLLLVSDVIAIECRIKYWRLGVNFWVFKYSENVISSKSMERKRKMYQLKTEPNFHLKALYKNEIKFA